ncbi:hypothetical protein REPUB_Repub05bG0039700 [Reevesia pubescens]
MIGSNVWCIGISKLGMYIMLDSIFNVKLGDFGLAWLMDHELDHRTTCLAGTLGYMAPEYVISGKASSKSDVFSFGVVTLEIVTGTRARDPRNNEMGLIKWRSKSTSPPVNEEPPPTDHFTITSDAIGEYSCHGLLFQAAG